MPLCWRMIDEAGVPLPVGATAKLLATGVLAPVGYEGEAYMQDLSPHNEVQVELPNGQSCKVTFEYHAVRARFPRSGRCAAWRRSNEAMARTGGAVAVRRWRTARGGTELLALRDDSEFRNLCWRGA